ncbi:hypothetical protein [Lutimonas zeaxanthinifaciens]|uniref:hypothetical protein n=1 Tax=Lutimonas zeaxanthinifaciens TaxID=3060215 RepID=UPI00265D246B|nr:hypothetical protein [Lutimonas sp. YSD2104]WKK64988.1 hypothetical protein QZH61_10385 [Lutimonas sp. YSD2104]
MPAKHTFHIPVMGTGFTLDTPLKVSHYGMDSVISIVDDVLIEKLRRSYCEKFEIPYQNITNKIEDFRAKRITSYLNLLQELTEEKFKQLKEATYESGVELRNYFDMLPDSSTIKEHFKAMLTENATWNDIKSWANDHLKMGSIDVNIMTKLDKSNYQNGKKLAQEYNDAHAALRGFAESNLESSLILSAGMNPRLYSYMEQFDDFYPDADGYIKKKIVIKVSDYRSALIQGKFLAKKGLWVSEYRIESGLNCGGHAFATEGFLLGPILDEFRMNRESLANTVNEIISKALADADRVQPKNPLTLKITAQGGVGTDEEHQFLIDHYGLDSVGWGSPFLLVPEATTVDDATLNKLSKAEEKDLYLSNISPLGVPFNNLKGNSKDEEKDIKIASGRPGSPCPKEFLALNSEYTDKSICTASRQYQRNKIKELEAENLPSKTFLKRFESIVEKSCLCVGLGAATEKIHNIKTNRPSKGVSICPGPNMAYFSKVMSLKDITDHIYGRNNFLSGKDRPHMFLKELKLYADYLKEKIEDTQGELNKRQEKYFLSFTRNMKNGINYYQNLFHKAVDRFEDSKNSISEELDRQMKSLEQFEKRLKSMTQI